MIYFVIAITSVLAGIVQGVTGFGTGVVLMMILPLYFALPQAAGISVAIAVGLCVAMCVRYRKDLKVKKVLLPCAWTIVCSSLAIHYSLSVNPDILKKIFGIFLIILSVYYLFFSKSDPDKKMSLPMAVFCVTGSGICDGLFGIGGPLMVLYFLSNTRSKREYLGTLQVFFLINGIYGTVFRITQGILGVRHLTFVGIGWLGILAGMFLANRVVDRMNAGLLRKLVYIMIGVSGIINLI